MPRKFSKPRGTRDFLPEEMEKRRYVEKVMRTTFERFGFKEILTPTFETLELITAKSGEEIVKSLYVFKDKSGRKLALRPELTAPVMRAYVNSLSKKPKPIKLYYLANCFRYERPQSGRYREFWQAGIEVIGGKFPYAEAEVIALADAILKNLGLGDYEIHIGNISILRKLLEEEGIAEKEQSRILTAIDKGEKEKLEGYERLLPLLELVGEEKKVIGKAEELLKESSAYEELQKLKELLEFLRYYNVDFKVNLGIARGLDYYTGMVFEIYSYRLGAEKQICGGGSYSLAEIFGGEPISTCGFAFGFDRVVLAIEKEGKISFDKGKSFFVVATDKEFIKEALNIAMQIRKRYPCEVELRERKLKKALGYADAKGFSHVIIVGEKEIKNRKVILKDMRTGMQKEVEISDIGEIL